MRVPAWFVAGIALCGCQQILGFQDTTVGAVDGGAVDAATEDAMVVENRCDGFMATEDLCDPVAQAGCDTGEKCTAVFPADNSGQAITRCVPDATVADGELCSRPTDTGGGIDSCRGDGSRVDDCAGGLVCQASAGEDRCTPICEVGAPGGCPDGTNGGRACAGFAGLFGDLTPRQTGACIPQCVPVSDGLVGRPNDTCGAGEGCFLNASTKELICVSIPDEAVTLLAFQECQPQPSPGTCFLNSAPQGAISLAPIDFGGTGARVVTPWCKPISTHLDVDPSLDVRVERANGDENVLACNNSNLASANGQCRYLSSMFTDLAELPEDLGICVPFSLGQDWNDSTQFDLAAWGADPMNVPFCPGCVTVQELEDAMAAGGNVAFDFRARLPKAPPELRARLEDFLKTREASR